MSVEKFYKQLFLSEKRRQGACDKEQDLARASEAGIKSYWIAE
ncbi:hypothetical protein [Kamptonema formosum]|nr:hypothetical protein [Oscillatoria sp. PCC 10802]